MKDQDIQVIVDSLGDSSVNLSARGWVLCEGLLENKMGDHGGDQTHI